MEPKFLTDKQEGRHLPTPAKASSRNFERSDPFVAETAMIRCRWQLGGAFSRLA